MNLKSTELLTPRERQAFYRWAEYQKFFKKYNMDPLTYLHHTRGAIYQQDIMNLMGIDDMVNDSARMKSEISTQSREFEKKVKGGKVPFQVERL